MRHQVKGTKFGRKKGDRNNFFQVLEHNLIMEGGIKTTSARAKALRPKVEKLVTLAKKQDLASLRLLRSRLPERSAFKLYHEVAPQYTDRKGGYLRIIKTAEHRMRDGADLVEIKFV
ncbi:MAG: 50S ribosomal protein L17 [Candidatus Colwellbacteria bacterium]|jgi:large subunit ribosomal protein L17|nr:50S ribosomal protein L17 [Candidatus Colwellbacteria bacterium]MCK9497599.1 50S ribosomal protein L17 [Candidatus Colwellbacteria bacterium]MDD3752409.1 50S ribosomal protein L17 [Candidatus Colwellbacteria bacterium]MDD4818808.1 50S ribosomal protein L17 [Candidatus Colwellbacteria bacterium]